MPKTKKLSETSMLARKRAREASGWVDDKSLPSHHFNASTGLRALLAASKLPATTYAVAKALNINSCYSRQVLAEHPEFIEARNALIASRWGSTCNRSDTEIIAVAEDEHRVKLPWPWQIWKLYSHAFEANPDTVLKTSFEFAKTLICAGRERPMSSRDTKNDNFSADYYAIAMLMMCDNPDLTISHARHSIPAVRKYFNGQYKIQGVTRMNETPREFLYKAHETIQDGDHLLVQPETEAIVRGYIVNVLNSNNNWIARWDLSDEPKMPTKPAPD